MMTVLSLRASPWEASMEGMVPDMARGRPVVAIALCVLCLCGEGGGQKRKGRARGQLPGTIEEDGQLETDGECAERAARSHRPMMQTLIPS